MEENVKTLDVPTEAKEKAKKKKRRSKKKGR